jgi:hypothetical protein
MENKNLNEAENPALNKADVSSWVATSRKLPDIDQDDNWNKDYQITKDVLTYSKEWGMRFGKYHYMSGNWTIQGVTSSNGVRVDYWQEVKPPCY